MKILSLFATLLLSVTAIATPFTQQPGSLSEPVLKVTLSHATSTASLSKHYPLFHIPLPDTFKYSAAGDATVETVTLTANQSLNISILGLAGSTSPITATFPDPMKLYIDPVTHTTNLSVPTKAPIVLTIKQDDAVFKLSIGPAKVADFSSQVSVLGVYVPSTGQYEFGLRAPTYSISSKLTIDAISVFNGGDSASLGAGLSYSTMLGTSAEPTAKGLFGFPAKVSFTVGFKSITFGNGTDGSGSHAIFVAFGLSIPTGKL